MKVAVVVCTLRVAIAAERRASLGEVDAKSMAAKKVGLGKTCPNPTSLGPVVPVLAAESEARIGLAGRDSVGVRGISSDVRGPHAGGSGRSAPRRDIAAGRHGLGREYGCRDQRSRQERHFGHVFLHMVREAKEARLLNVRCGEPCAVKRKLSSRAFKDARAAMVGA